MSASNFGLTSFFLTGKYDVIIYAETGPFMKNNKQSIKYCLKKETQCRKDITLALYTSYRDSYKVCSPPTDCTVLLIHYPKINILSFEYSKYY